MTKNAKQPSKIELQASESVNEFEQKYEQPLEQKEDMLMPATEESKILE